MAAGMGSRFGGLKQIEPMGPSNEFIIDYSIYDAIKAGFNKVVFIIKEENFTVFKETIGKRVEPHINVEYVFQKMTIFLMNTKKLKIEKNHLVQLKQYFAVKKKCMNHSQLLMQMISMDEMLILKQANFY